MKKIILDTNILIQWPGILAKKREGTQFVISSSPLQELTEFTTMRAEGKTLLDLISQSMTAGLTVTHQNRTTLADQRSLGLSRVDLDVAASAFELQNQGLDVAIATDDRVLLQYARLHALKTKTLKDLRAEFGEDTDSNSQIALSAANVVSIQNRSLALGVLIGIAVSLTVAVVWINFVFIVNTIRIWGLVLGLLITGVALYWFRGRNRLAYGIAEFLVGVCTGIMIFLPDYNLAKITGRSFFQLLAALYVMVRGLDNIGKALSGTRCHAAWKCLFGDQ
jgi:hypothetical protein